MSTKENPGQFDCYSRAEPNEPMFVLLGRDAAAPILIEAWMALRLSDDPAKLVEAQDCAHACYTWLMKLGKRDAWNAVKDNWFKINDAFPRSARLGFDLAIGRLDHVLSQLIGFAKDKTRDETDRQTLKHHAEDMIGAGQKILRELATEPAYTCEHCGVASPKPAWGPGRVTCPQCKKVASSAAESERAA